MRSTLGISHGNMPCLDECFSCAMVTGSDKHCFSFQSCGITLAVHHLYKISVIEGSLEVKLPTAWTDEKQRREGKKKENQKEKRREEERSKKRKSQKEEDPSARKGRKVAKHGVFPMICGLGGSKSRLAKAAVRSHVARWEMKNCAPLQREARVQVKKLKTPHVRSTPLWREAHFEVKMYKTHQVRATFGSWDVEKVHAVVARSAFRSQNIKNTTCSRHFWTLKCRLAGARDGAPR